MTKTAVRKLVDKKTGILLDVSLGGTPQSGSVTFSDLAHDPRKLPWPLPNGCVHTAVVTHVLEYLEPERFFRWFDELHRVMRGEGICYISGPYGGDESVGWLSDPMHRTRIVEASFSWLDNRTPIYPLHETLARPLPKPWHVIALARVPGTLGTLSYNCTLRAANVGGSNGKRR